MSDKSKIEWTDATWNPLRGCTPVSEGCRRCYAAKVASRFPWGARVAKGGKWLGNVEFVESALTAPLRWRTPRRIFVNSMSDLFHDAVPDEWIDRVFAVMALAPRHTFQILTKRPERMRAWATGRVGLETRESEVAREAEHVGKIVWDGRGSDPAKYGTVCGGAGDVSNRRAWPGWPLRNVWLGVSVEDQATAEERIPLLLQTPAAVRFVSFEPLIADLRDFRMDGIAWAIFGGESGSGARSCNIDWIRGGMATCRHYGTAIFVKQLGARPYWCDPSARSEYDVGGGEIELRDRAGADPAEWPEDLRVREFPDVPRG